MREITTSMFAAALQHTCKLIVASEAQLTELDSRVGDGDHGMGMRDGFSELLEVLEHQTFETFHELAYTAGISLVKAMGGASGVIFGTMFIGGLDALSTPDGTPLKTMDADTMCRYFRLSAEAIAHRGHTQPNDRTMLDALLCAVDVMEKSGEQDIKKLLEYAWKGACCGAQATSQMQPKRGRAMNFRELAIGWPDPGAVSTSIIFQGLYEGIQVFSEEYDSPNIKEEGK